MWSHGFCWRPQRSVCMLKIYYHIRDVNLPWNLENFLRETRWRNLEHGVAKLSNSSMLVPLKVMHELIVKDCISIRIRNSSPTPGAWEIVSQAYLTQCSQCNLKIWRGPVRNGPRALLHCKENVASVWRWCLQHAQYIICCSWLGNDVHKWALKRSTTLASRQGQHLWCLYKIPLVS